MFLQFSQIPYFKVTELGVTATTSRRRGWLVIDGDRAAQ